MLVAEDSRFFEHEGVDLEEIKKSIEINMDKRAPSAAPARSRSSWRKILVSVAVEDPLRKLKELIIARRLEAALPKARIFEIYLNVIEWGDGVWGAEAAARQ